MSVSTPVLRTTRPTRPGPSFFAAVPNEKLSAAYEPFPMQKKIHYSKALYRIACLGRQVGKSELSSVEAAFELCVNPGSKGWVVAPTFGQASIIFKRTLAKAQWYVQRHPNLRLKYRRGASLEITVEHFDRDWKLPGAVSVGMSEFNGKSGNQPDNLVGATLTYLIIDEAAVVQQMAWEEALSPMLSTTQGWVLFVSTPRGFNWFYDLFMKGRSALAEDIAFESFNAASWDANPTVPRSFYESEKRKKTELVFRQEYGAEFVSNSGSVFQGIDKLPFLAYDPALSRPEEGVLVSRKPRLDATYTIGADFGKMQDYTVYTVLDMTSTQVVATYRYGFVDYDRQLDSLKKLSDHWNGALVVGDIGGPGEVLDKEARKLGIPWEGVKFTGAVKKAEVINHLAIGLEQGYVQLLDDPGLIHELRMYKYRRTDSGQLVMKAEGRGHDDRVVSLALAYSKVGAHGTVNYEELEQMLAAEFDNPSPVSLGHQQSGFTPGGDLFSEANSLLRLY